jgi:Di-haem oxidoreductase, putative peroxidase
MMKSLLIVAATVFVLSASARIGGQLVDRTKAPSTSSDGIPLPLIGSPFPSQIGDGRTGSVWNSSRNLIALDPFRAIRRGRQLFQRKFTKLEGQGPGSGDGFGTIDTDVSIGAGLADSCAACHGRPRGSAGFGGDVVTRPDSRDAQHLFGLGLKEMLADEITEQLRATRAAAIKQALRTGAHVVRPLVAKGIHFGSITARPDGSVGTSTVQGVDADLRVRPFSSHGGTISIREFVVGALKSEMGLAMADDPDLIAARSGAVSTPTGMVLNGLSDTIEQPPMNEGDIGTLEQRTALVDFLEFYLLNYFKPGIGETTSTTKRGRDMFSEIGCAGCHVPSIRIDRDRRVADVETIFDPDRGHFNRLFASARLLLANPSSIGQSMVPKRPALQPFVVENIFTDFKRHDLGPNFYERQYDGSVRTEFMTAPLWGVGSTAPYGHDGRSINLKEVILRHGGEAQQARNAFAALPTRTRDALIAFLNSLIIFPPDDTASDLDPGDRTAPGFPQNRHGSIRLTGLFNNPLIVE